VAELEKHASLASGTVAVALKQYALASELAVAVSVTWPALGALTATAFMTGAAGASAVDPPPPPPPPQADNKEDAKANKQRVFNIFKRSKSNKKTTLFTLSTHALNLRPGAWLRVDVPWGRHDLLRKTMKEFQRPFLEANIYQGSTKLLD
jgi:hypothetical protein